MLKKIEAMFNCSLVRHICQGSAFALACIFGLLAVITFFVALVESVWWLIVTLIAGPLCGALFGFYWWLEH